MTDNGPTIANKSAILCSSMGDARLIDSAVKERGIPIQARCQASRLGTGAWRARGATAQRRLKRAIIY
eukprot:5396901-Pyramimonas_sp.AAC.1